ncbi:hypothetical protein GIB67_037206, partial [Kingdonia uniflora]
MAFLLLSFMDRHTNLNIGCWNIRGINDNCKKEEVSSWIKRNNLFMFGISEHKILDENIKTIADSICRGWAFTFNNSQNGKSRILLCWDPQLIKVEQVILEEQHITCNVHHIYGISFCSSFIYGCNSYIKRRILWDQICMISANMSLPWTLLGDFNAIQSSREKVGGIPVPRHTIVEFMNCLQMAGLVDCKFQGNFLTWSNKSTRGKRVAVKLNRVLINSQWMNTFNYSQAKFLNPIVSDHSPYILNITSPSSSNPKPFKFYNCWVDDSEFLDVVKNAWKFQIEGNATFIFVSKLKNVKKKLKKKFSKAFSHLDTQIFNAKNALDILQDNLQIDPLNQNLATQEKLALKFFVDLVKIDEHVKKQKSRVQWLQLGDSNSKFFHNSIKARRARNRILSIIDSNGSALNIEKDICKEGVSWFENFLGNSHCPQTRFNDLQSLNMNRITGEDRDELEKSISTLEIFECLQD